MISASNAAEQMAQNKRRVAPYIVIALGTLLVLCVFGLSFRQGGLLTHSKPNQLANPAARAGSQKLRGNNATRPSSAPVPTEACGNKTIVYPEWPPGFQPNVSAVFIIGAHQCSLPPASYHQLEAHSN